MEDIYKNAFLDRFLFHIRTVQDNMIILENNLSKLDFQIKPFQLLERSLYHDLDKLEPNLVGTYVEFTKYHYNKKIGIEYIFDKEKCLENVQLHYENQRHHFYKNNMVPNVIDICEMCSDVTAISIEKKEENNLFYYKNTMIKEYENIKKYDSIIVNVFDILWKLIKDFNYDDEEKYIFVKNRIEKIRKFQDAMIFLERNNAKLPFKINDFEIVKRALNVDKNILYNDDYSFFDIKKKEISGLDICIFCCEYFINKNEYLIDLFQNNEILKEYKKDIKNVLILLDNKDIE